MLGKNGGIFNWQTKYLLAGTVGRTLRSHRVNKTSMPKRALLTNPSAVPNAGPQGRISNVAVVIGKCTPLYAHGAAKKRWFLSSHQTTNRYIVVIVSSLRAGGGRITDTKQQRPRHLYVAGPNFMLMLKFTAPMAFYILPIGPRYSLAI